MKFRFLADQAISDAAFVAFGKTTPELFENAALAVFEQGADTKKIQPKKSIQIRLQNTDLENLLYSFLSEIVFVKDSKQLLFSSCNVKIKKTKQNFFLTAKLHGQPVFELTPAILRNDVKAVTLHQFGISKTKTGWKARAVLDL